MGNAKNWMVQVRIAAEKTKALVSWTGKEQEAMKGLTYKWKNGTNATTWEKCVVVVITNKKETTWESVWEVQSRMLYETSDALVTRWGPRVA
jgi:hypothetical protein